jgi:hypothetical protein
MSFVCNGILQCEALAGALYAPVASGSGALHENPPKAASFRFRALKRPYAFQFQDRAMAVKLVLQGCLGRPVKAAEIFA